MTREQSLPATEAEDMDRVAEVIEKHMKVLSTATEKGIRDTELITVAGYACFVALRQVTKYYLSRNQVLWSALLMLISLALFVLFEV